jgi:AcrR family transcriptional regulator
VGVARKSADQRREEIVEIAFRHFAEGGYKGTSTEDIAREAGISQPYLFRLFHTKKELFLACSDRCYEQVADVFRTAVEGVSPEERMAAMGQAYGDKLLRDRHALMFQMQSHGTGDAEIHAQVRDGFNTLRQTVADLAGVAPDATWQFFADGMLLNVLAMLDLDWKHPEHQ